MPISWNEIRHNAVGFSRRWVGTTSETAERQTFWNEFFQVIGLQRRLVATFEESVLRKVYTGTRWIFTEGRNSLNPASPCDIAWAGALATHAHTERKSQAGGCVVYDHWDGVNASNAAAFAKLSPENQLLWSNDPAIWRPLR